MGLSIGRTGPSGSGISSVSTRLRSKLSDRTPGILKQSGRAGLSGTTRSGIAALRGNVTGARSNLRAISGVRRGIDVRA